jgi:hypothetical protein
MKSKKGGRPSAPREQGPPPASDRLIEAMQGAVTRARAKKLAGSPEPSNQHLNPFAENPEDESGGGIRESVESTGGAEQEKRTADAAQ